MPLRIAMWSGPRNISTALLRSWGNRPDTAVCDEPLYAHYLQQTGLDHPGAAEVIAHHEPDWRKAVAGLVGAVPGGKPIFYQKHMAHHLLPQVGRDWLGRLTHAFLIRDPRAMLPSLDKVFPNPGLADTGLPQQREIFALVPRSRPTCPPWSMRATSWKTRARCSASCATAGRRVRRGDAPLATRPASDRRHLGEVLVRRRRAFDHLRALSPQGRAVPRKAEGPPRSSVSRSTTSSTAIGSSRGQ